MTGRIHSFQSLGTVDGPGVRYVVFLSGCPLRCPYCHNPDTWDMAQGQEYTVEEIVRRVGRVREYLSGGVTISGGEPLMQPGFVLELLRALRSEGYHTALDTSGALLPSELGEILSSVNLLLLDLKMNTDRAYRQHIGLAMDRPLALLRLAEEMGVSTWIRQVVVPGIHDAPGEMERLRACIAPYRCVERVELLPLRKLCLEKYRRMGIPFPMADVEEPGRALMDALSARLRAPSPPLKGKGK